MNSSGSTATDITVQRTDISGFYASASNDNRAGSEIRLMGYQQSAIDHVQILNNVLHGSLGPTSPDDNGVSGNGGITNDWMIKNISNVTIDGNTIYNIGSRASANPGEVGNGILVANTTSALVQHNIVHDIGGNTTTCGGPGGVWAYTSDQVTIQYNESYYARPVSAAALAAGSAAGSYSACDWDGFDLDINVTNSIVQYNYSHDNFGGGFLIFGSVSTVVSPQIWGPNIIRYNISENDALGTNTWFGGITLSVQSPSLHVDIYNNTVYNSHSSGVADIGAFVYASTYSDMTGVVANNIFDSTAHNSSARGPLLQMHGGGNATAMKFVHNDYFTNGAPPSILWNNTTYTNLATWSSATGKDAQWSNADPKLTAVGTAGICASGFGITCIAPYVLLSASPFVGTGINLSAAPYNLSVGTKNAYGATIPAAGGSGYNVGAY